MNSAQWEQVKDIFHDAAAMSEEERDNFLLSKCGDDETLLNELRSLFQAHAEYDGFIETPAYRSVSSLVDGEIPAHSSPTPIAASAAVSTVKTPGDIIKPPAPEKGSKLMMSLAITAGVLALALVGVLILAFVTGVF